ncbi:hypothetical protein [Archangium lipolyticum]|uniref:hypothetical protein n=1 Tax=Archangium lipolyticum TaxID=2970465 RepID=UPI002149EAA3|nr:hypothetical protein [Archangium lipolyticum]
MSPVREPSPGDVLLRAILGMFLFFLLGVVSAGLVIAVASAARNNLVFWLGPLSYFAVPIIAYVMMRKRTPPERSEGSGIGLALFVGLSLLLPLVICGGMLASSNMR